MGVYDGAVVCELIGTFLLNLLGWQYDRKKKLAYIRIMDCQFLRTAVVRKWKQKVFKNNGLDVIVDSVI